MNSRFRAVAVVLLVWALIYLPALGSIAIKGEEGRRILPAVRMLETGNYIVPQIGSNPYFRKPPLVNWLVAASFAVSGVRNEWTARLPSALAVLAVAIAFMTVARASLGPTGSLIAAIIWMTNIGMIEKGRRLMNPSGQDWRVPPSRMQSRQQARQAQRADAPSTRCAHQKLRRRRPPASSPKEACGNTDYFLFAGRCSYRSRASELPARFVDLLRL